MKTLADLKRDIQVGTKILCNGIEEAKIREDWEGGDISNAPYGELYSVPLKEKMQGERTVTHKDTTGFYLSATPEDGKRGSFCGWVKAGDLAYTGTTFTITERTKLGYVWQVRHYTIY